MSDTTDNTPGNEIAANSVTADTLKANTVTTGKLGGNQQGDDTQHGSGGEDVSKLKTALDRERALRRTAEKEAREAAATKQRLDELEAATQSDTEKAVAAARREGAQEATASANTRLIAAEARALAAEAGFRNPQLAVRAVTDELRGVKVADDGAVDTDAITTALKTLADAEPYLLKGDEPRLPKPDPSQGSGKTVQPPQGGKGIAEAQRRFGAPAATSGAGTT